MKTKVNNSSAEEIILTFFLNEPRREIHLRALARETNLSPAGILKASKNLIKNNIIKVEKDKEKNLLILKANRDDNLFFSLKRSRNIYTLSHCGLLKYLIKSYERPEAIILFGSYSKGEDIEESDVDIAIITKRNLQLDLKLFQKKIGRKIKILELNKEKIQKQFWQTLANGIVLYGYLEIPL